MPELETLFVRIEADLSAFKRGIAEANRETRGFANEAKRAFADVATALDLGPFRKELAQSERAAIQAAERMSKAFAEVGKAQERAALRCLEKLAEGAGRSGVFVRQDTERASGAPFGLSESQEEIRQRALGGAAGFSAVASFFPRIVAAVTLPGGIIILLGATLAGVLLPEIIKALSGGGGSIESLNSQIAALQSEKRLVDPFTSDIAKERKQAIQEQIDAFTSLRDALLEQQRLTSDSTAQNQQLLSAFTGLPESLNQLGGRIDSLVRELRGNAGDAAAQSQELLDAVAELGDSLGRLCECIGGRRSPRDEDSDESEPEESGAGAPIRLASFGAAAPLDGDLFRRASFDGARFRRASFDGAAPLDGAGLDGLDRELADAGFRVQDLSAGFVELTEATGGFEAQGGALVAFLTQSNALLGEQSGLLGQLTAQAPALGGEFSTLLDAFKGAAFEGKSFREVLLKIIQDTLVLSQASLGGGSGGRTTEGDSFGSALTKKHEVKNKKEENDPQVPELHTDLRRSSAAQTNVGLGFRRFAAIPTNLGRNRGSFALHVQRPPKFCARTTIPISNPAPSMPSKASNKPWNSSRLQWMQREAIGLTASRQYLQGIVAISHLHLDSTTRSIAHA